MATHCQCMATEGLGPMGPGAGQEKKGGFSGPVWYYGWVDPAPLFFLGPGPGPWAQGPLWPCIGHDWAYLIYFVIK